MVSFTFKVNNVDYSGMIERDSYETSLSPVYGETITTTKEMTVGLYKPTQRMGIAQLGPLSYLCIATEGPENKGSVGLTIAQFAQLMKDRGAIMAYNLDGGSSSAMMFNDQKINALSTNKTRPICDILYFATLVGE